MKPLTALTLLLILAAFCQGPQDRWMREPIRWLQTNMREADAAIDPARYVADAADFNVLLMAMAGFRPFTPAKCSFTS